MKWTVAPWTNPRDKTDWFGLFGDNKETPAMVFSVENDAHRWAGVMNEPEPVS